MPLEKDKSIVQLLGRLDLDARGWVVVDHWEADLLAIGIAAASSKRRLVYVSTFGKPVGRFDYACETSGHQTEYKTAYEVSEEGQDVSFEDLVNIIERHLLAE